MAEEKNNGKEIVRFDGGISGKSGWNYAAPSGGNVYIPFEGTYEDKGGRLVSRKIPLDKTSGEHAFYRLDFTARTGASCYWWIDYFDKDGNPLPDCNSAIYPGPERRYSEVFQAHPDAKEIRIIFSSSKGVSVRDIVLTRITDAEAAAWCDELFAKETPGFTPVLRAERNEALPKTKAALKEKKPFTAVLLGDSIMNDTYTSNFIALFNRAFPGNRFRFLLSVRGSTGCPYYSEPQNFRDYVAKYKPDLVMIGGISNRQEESPEKAEASMKSVIGQSLALGAEVLVLTPPPSWEWRESPDDTKWSTTFRTAQGTMPLDSEYERNAASACGVALWDMTTGPCDYIAASRNPLDYFRRDAVHNNDRGKQLIGRNLVEYFKLLGKQELPSRSN
ncbi:MAG: hypothetical protein BWY31_04615 [Lentisphaerae bacterium ADurb.Bin242]|nr:MAG: hypothetical protein BWY31_04615 [Lentisphaerae bacterium ADurb.Bin242]